VGFLGKHATKTVVKQPLTHVIRVDSTCSSSQSGMVSRCFNMFQPGKWIKIMEFAKKLRRPS
jgi:hypothetical protein